MKRLMIVLIMIISVPCFADWNATQRLLYTPDPWTTQDTVLQLSFTTLGIMDWLQTRWIATHPIIVKSVIIGDMQRTYQIDFPQRHREGNQFIALFIGENPNLTKVNIFIPAGIISHALISYWLPRSYRTIWQSIFIGLEINAVYRNYRAECKFQF